MGSCIGKIRGIFRFVWVHPRARRATASSGLIIAASLLMTGVTARAAVTPGSIETWNSGSVEGWKVLDVLNWNYRPVSNVGGAVDMKFNQSTITFPQSYMFQGDSGASGGVFIGDYVAAGIASIRFKMNCTVLVPHSVRVYIHGAAGNQWWYQDVPLGQLAVGEFREIDVLMSYASGWRQGIGDTEAGYLSALSNVDWVGVYIRRNDDAQEQHYQLDDFEVLGAPAATTISGLVSYSGQQVGGVDVLATTDSNSWDMTYSDVTTAGSGYSMTGVLTQVSYFVKGYMDSDGSGTHDFWEAIGWYNAGSALGPVVGPETGINIVLLDPGTVDGLPYWWLRQEFGMTNSGDSVPAAEEDSDGDGVTNLDEYYTETDPNDGSDYFHAEITVQADGILISWNGPSDEPYTVWRTADVTVGAFDELTNSYVSTEYLDETGTVDGPYFYRVEMETGVAGE